MQDAMADKGLYGPPTGGLLVGVGVWGSHGSIGSCAWGGGLKEQKRGTYAALPLPV